MKNDARDDFFVSFTDENGVENHFEILAVIEYQGTDYAVMLPEEGSPSYNGMVYVFEIAEELDSDTDTYLGVEDEAVIEAVYDLFCDEVRRLEEES